MKRLLALLLSVTSSAALAQTTGAVSPSSALAEPSVNEDVPPGGCLPIGLTISGDIVFPIQCKEFIERHRGTAVERKPAAVEEKPPAKQSEAVAPETSQPANKPVETVPLPRRVEDDPRKRAVGSANCTHYRTYDPASGTYRGYDGRIRSCRVEKTAASQPTEPKPASLNANSATTKVKSTIAAKAEKRSSAHARDRDHLATKTAKPTMIAAKVGPPASDQPAANVAPSSTTTGPNTASSPPQGSSAASSNSKSSKTALGGDADKTVPAPPNNADHLVAILLVRPEIESISDLANKNVAVDDWQSASAPSVRTAIVAAGAADVQMSEGKTLAIERVTSGEVPAAVLMLVSPEAAEKWLPEIAGFKVFRIPLSPRSVVR
jgi:hypothetical protein